MEFRKMVTITLCTRQQKRYWCIEQSYGLCGRGRGWEDLGEWHWNFLFWWSICLVLVSGWWWLYRMSLGVFLPLQSFGRVWEGSVKIFLFCLVEFSCEAIWFLDFCLYGVLFFFNYIFCLVSSDQSGEGNGTPLQCSCLENPRDGGAWWAAIYGVAQSRTRLKLLSSSSSRHSCVHLGII